MTQQIFEAALGIHSPWYISDVDLDTDSQVLTIKIDSERGFRFAVDNAPVQYTAHDETYKIRQKHIIINPIISDRWVSLRPSLETSAASDAYTRRMNNTIIPIAFRSKLLRFLQTLL